MPKKKSLSYAEMAKAVAKDAVTNSSEAKAVKAVGRKVGEHASKAGGYAKAMYNSKDKAKTAQDLFFGDTELTPLRAGGFKDQAEHDDYMAEKKRVGSMGSAAWAKAKKKAGIKD